MTQVKRRYTTADKRNDWIVTVSYDERGLDKAHWFEAQVAAENERTGEKMKFPPELRTYRIGEIEHTFRQYIDLDFGGDCEAAIEHHLNTIYRRIYDYIARGH
jgi:hypothetical protein